MGPGSADGVCGHLTSSAKLTNEGNGGPHEADAELVMHREVVRSHLTSVVYIDYRVESAGSSTLDGRQNSPPSWEWLYGLAGRESMAIRDALKTQPVSLSKGKS